MKSPSFLLSVLSENGQPSSKRVAFFILLILYTFVLLYNTFTGKAPSDTIENQLYYMLVTNLGVILGSNVIDAIKGVKIVQSNNNANVGEASPTKEPAPVVVAAAAAPAPATVINN